MKKYSLALSVILLAASCNKQTALSNIQSQPSVQSTVSPKIYKDTDLGYQVSYPVDWNLSQVDNTSAILIQKSLTYFVSIDYYPDVQSEPGNKNNKLGAKTLGDLMKLDKNFSNSTQTELSGELAYSAAWNGYGSYYEVLSEHNGHLYVISFENAQEISDLTTEEKAILSSFQFLH